MDYRDYPGGSYKFISDYIGSVSSEGVEHRGLDVEHTLDGDAYTFRFTGSKEAMLALSDQRAPESRLAFGRLTTCHITQQEGPLWRCELRFESHLGSGETSPPDTSYGARSCRLSVSMLSNDLNTHPSYLTNWNHYLLASPGTSTVPGWWATAKDLAMNETDAQKYKWVSSAESSPSAPSGQQWYILKSPTKPGVSRYDTACYTVVETARFRSAEQAGKMVAGKSNTIGTPSNTFGITGGNWKCDGAEVSWRGKFWLATLTWTRSATNAGWDTDIY